MGGDSGNLAFYDIKSKERTRKFATGDVFITGIGKAKKRPFIATGNNNGGVHIANMSGEK